MFIPIVICPEKNKSKNYHFVNISAQLADQLSIKKKQDIKICIGKKTQLIKIQIVEEGQNEIYLSEQLLNDFLLPIQKIPVLGWYEQKDHLFQLGPIIGLLTDFILLENGEPNFQSVHSFCEELHQGVLEFGGLFYVFHYKDLTEQEVQGYYFENGKWSQSKLPLPNVIYNRIHSRKMEKASSFKSFRKKLERLNIPLFNDRFLSKWEVHEQLMHEEKIHPNIPETRILSKDHLEEMLEKYSTVFIKPVNGSQGRNIIKLYNNQDQICYQTSQNHLLDSAQMKSIDEVFQQLKPIIHNKIYIIQRGISLAMYQSRSMDFRVLVNRNAENLWETTSIIARVSAEAQFVSNLAKGGEAIKPFTALCSIFDIQTTKELLSLMKKLSIEAATVISAYSDGITGELGIDIGVDQAGGLWIIEINSKPSKNFEGPQRKIRPSAKAIIQFCTKLAFDFI